LIGYDGENTAFGLVFGLEAEPGYLSTSGLEEAREPLGLRVERDRWLEPAPVTRLEECRARWGERDGRYSP